MDSERPDILRPLFDTYEESAVYFDEAGTDYRFEVESQEEKSKPILVGIATRTDKPTERQLWDLFEKQRTGHKSYIAVLTPDFCIVFSQIDFQGIECIRTHGGLPERDGTVPQKKPITSPQEAEILYDLASKDGKSRRHRAISSFDTILNIYRRYEADRRDIDLALDENLTSRINTLDEEVKKENPVISLPADGPLKMDGIRGLTVFAGYSLLETDIQIRESLISYISQEMQHYVPEPLSELIVDEAEVSPDERVLVPFCGTGTLVRSLAHDDTEVVGLERKTDVATICAALNNIVECDVDIRHLDFLAESKDPDSNNEQQSLTEFSNDMTESPENDLYGFDHVVTVPPLGVHLRKEDLRQDLRESGIRYTEEAVCIASMERLSSGGRFTALLPRSLFYRNSASEVRHLLFRENKVERMVEIKSGSPLLDVSAPLILLQASAGRVSGPYQIDISIIDQDEMDIESLIQKIRTETTQNLSSSDFENTYVPSEILRTEDALSKLKTEVQNLIELGESADIRSGKKVKKENLIREEGTPFLQIGDVTGDIHQDGPRTVPPSLLDEVDTTNEAEVLLSIRGTIGVAILPEEDVVPASNWARLQFSTRQEALIYCGFLNSPLGRELLESQVVGSVIDYIPLNKLRKVNVPDYRGVEGSDLVEELESLDIDWSKALSDEERQIVSEILEIAGENQ